MADTSRPAHAAFRLPALFGDHMVVQRDRPIPVWGWDRPGQTVTVTFDGRSRHTTCDADGRWRVQLPAHRAGASFDLVVDGSQSVRLRNVAVGEVWFCAGQSNMEWPVKWSSDAARELDRADHPAIRLFTLPKRCAVAPQVDTPGTWHPCTPASVASFSAVAYAFGRDLQRRLELPVGLITAAWSGTGIDAWSSREALLDEPLRHAMMTTFVNSLQDYDAALADYHTRFRAWQDAHLPSDPGNTGYAAGWADPASDTADWPVMQTPCTWQSAGLTFNGVVWFRRAVDIPPAWAGRDLVLSPGICDDYDTTYFDNVPVGATGRETPRTWQVPRRYTVPGTRVKAGRHVIAIRILDHLGGGGLTGPADRMFLAPAGAPDTERIELTGGWRYRVEHTFGTVRAPGSPMPPPDPENPNAPAALFNGMVAPVIPFGIRGVIWYQGEANAPEAWTYRTLFPNLIGDWRAKWKQGDFPFLFVQLANHQARRDQPVDSQWAELREAQRVTLQVPHTAMAVAIDIGEADDVHPKNKREVGRRLAQAALAHAYGHTDVVPSGPLYRSHRIADGAIRIGFDGLGGGLVCKGDALTGFAIAGEDRRFVWAEAEIVGDVVVISSPAVPRPAAVRYAWADNPACALYNRAGLPASPFRTDDWPLTTQPEG